jgi:hypothetical protein
MSPSSECSSELLVDDVGTGGTPLEFVWVAAVLIFHSTVRFKKDVPENYHVFYRLTYHGRAVRNKSGDIIAYKGKPFVK